MVDDCPAPLSDAAPALVALRAALTRLAGCDLPEAARAALSEAEAALALLEADQDDAVDRAAFDALMQMAGPEVAPRLLSQMDADLTAVRRILDLALQAADLGEIRAQTHVLIALAGSAGALGVEEGARQMNRAAHEMDVTRIRALRRGLMAGLEALISFIRQESAERAT